MCVSSLPPYRLPPIPLLLTNLSCKLENHEQQDTHTHTYKYILHAQRGEREKWLPTNDRMAEMAKSVLFRTGLFLSCSSFTSRFAWETIGTNEK